MPKNKQYLHLLFEAQVKLTPDNIAIIDIDHHSEISFNELNKQANKLAKLLCQRGVTRGTFVAIIIDSSIYFAIAVLAVLKNNAIYIPIDTSYPVIKKIELIKDATAMHLLLSPGSDEEFSKEIPLLKITRVNEDDLKNYSTENMDIEHTSIPFSHISYTSGTSGKPKGVLIKHEGMINHVHWRIKTYGYTSKDVTLQLVSNSMDGFSAIFFAALLSGGKLVLLSNAKRKDFFFINKVIQSKNITNFCIVPSMLQGLLNYQVNFASLRFIVLAGEKINPNLIKKIKNKKQDIKLISEYGPAESTCTTSFNINLNENNTTHIGQPIDNMEIFLLDDDLNEQTEGEICISGKGVASGYHNNEKLTRSKFLNSSGLDEKIIYRTGDFARKLANGAIEYIGRIDRQVKIRGHRIELEEIENCILQYDGIIGTIVKVIKDHDSNALCAYLVLNNKEINIPALKKFITSRLPTQTIPSFFVVLDSFPLTTNGKISIDELPNPINKHCEAINKPKTECQEILRGFFSDALGKLDSEIGITDNFFEMGGNSLNIAILLSKIKNHYDKVIPIDKFKEISTIEKMAAYIKDCEDILYC